MALKSTICKAELHVSDLDRHYYQAHNLTLAGILPKPTSG